MYPLSCFNNYQNMSNFVSFKHSFPSPFLHLQHTPDYLKQAGYIFKVETRFPDMQDEACKRESVSSKIVKLGKGNVEVAIHCCGEGLDRNQVLCFHLITQSLKMEDFHCYDQRDLWWWSNSREMQCRWFWGRDPRARKWGTIWELEKARKWGFLEPPERNTVLLTSLLVHWNPCWIFELQNSRMI